MEAPAPSVVLDASAVTALFRDEPGSKTVAELLRSGHARMSAVNVAEVIDVLVRVHGGSPQEVVEAVEELFSTGVRPVPVSLEQAIDVGELRARVFDRRGQRVSLADCFVLVSASTEDTIVTTDTVLADVARAEGLQVVVAR